MEHNMKHINFDEAINQMINAELHRQSDKWGKQNHSPEVWLVILSEELGEASKAILEKDQLALIAELTQVAAVAISAIDNLLHTED